MTTEHGANLRADQSLLVVTGLGASLSVLRIFASADSTIPWASGFSVGILDPWLWIAAPMALLLGAYLVVAAGEKREEQRHQRGAMAVLVALAVGMAFFFINFPFNPVYGVTLLLLAVRTRGVLTAAVGVFAFVAAFGIPSFESASAAVGLSLVAAASLIAATRVRHDRRNQSDNAHV